MLQIRYRSNLPLLYRNVEILLEFLRDRVARNEGNEKTHVLRITWHLQSLRSIVFTYSVIISVIHAANVPDGIMAAARDIKYLACRLPLSQVI